MNLGRTVFSQLVNFLPTYQFQIFVDRYQGNRYVKNFPAGISSFVWPSQSSPTAKVSAISKPVCVPSNPSFITWASGANSRNTLAHANEHRDWRIYVDFAQILIATARDLCRDKPFGVELSESVYAVPIEHAIRCECL
jgi:hypothetical protein